MHFKTRGYCTPVILLFTMISYSPLSFAQTGETKPETIFDRISHIQEDIHEVPNVPRYEELMGLTGRYELVGDVNLWVERVGEGSPMVMISGGPGTSHHYFHPHFTKAMEFSELIFYDMRGVGLSEYDPSKNGYSIMQAVEDLEKLRQKLGYDRWIVFGLSFGGAIAQLYAIEYPEHLLGMVLVSSVLPMSIDIGIGSRQYDYMSKEEKERISEIYAIAGEQATPVHSDRVSPDLQKKMLYNGFLNGDWKRRHILRWTKEDIAMYARYEFVHDKNYYLSMFDDYFQYDLKNVFKTFPFPTLIIEGKWDLAYSLEKADIIFEQFPEAKHVYMDSVGHLPYEDEPEFFLEELENFINTAAFPDSEVIEKWKKRVSQMEIRKLNKVQFAPFEED